MAVRGGSQPRHPGMGNAGLALSLTLFEFFIVVTIMAVLAAVALPQYLEVLGRAQETKAMQYMKSWPIAQENYKAKYGWYANAHDQMVREQLIPVVLASDSSLAGYNFSIDSPTKSTTGWWGRGWPVKANSRSRYFYIDETGTLRYEIGKWASSKSPALE